MRIDKIKLAICKETYTCDKCSKEGHQNNMVLVFGKGLFHAKCYKQIK